MSNGKHLKRVFYISIKLGIIAFLLLASFTFANADPAELYLDWELEGRKGHLTISNYPKVLEETQTYKVGINIILESGVDLELGTINFTVNLPETNPPLSLGYSTVHTALKKNESINLVSHWKIQEIPINQTEGNLTIETSMGNLITIPEEIVIKFRIKTELKLNVPNSLRRGETLILNGSIKPAIDGIKISLTYLMPNGTTVVRGASPDKVGNFNDKYVPGFEGTWWVKASWNGTENFAPASSKYTSFTVNPPIPIILIVGIIGFISWAFITLLVHCFQKDEDKIYPFAEESSQNKTSEKTKDQEKSNLFR